MTNRRISLRLLLSFLLLAATACAHFVWLERDPATGAVAAFFGEWSADVRETQDGYLTLIAAPAATDATGRTLPVEIAHDRIHVSTTTATTGDLRLDNRYLGEKGTTLTHYQAKLGRGDTTARHPLELVPVIAGSNTFILLFRGAPLASTAVTLFTAAGWNRTFTTDDDGRVTLETPWPGQAIVEVAHREAVSGEHAGRTYDAIRHVSTLTFQVDAP